MTVVVNGKRFAQFSYPNEKDFEQDVVQFAKVLFGPSVVYIDAKKRLESKTLGNTVPDGFLFVFSEPTDPRFYIVEVEISEHSFYSHIFPQITKFFAFYRNTAVRKTLADQLHVLIDSDKALKSEFKSHLGTGEVYKFLSDMLETSQNILLISDDTIRELPEIFDTYTDTWGKLVKYLEVRKYTSGTDVVFSLTPDFETLPYAEPGQGDDGPGNGEISERDHLLGVAEQVESVYKKIKEVAASIDNRLVFNSQKYYISIKAGKNIVFLEIRKSKIRFIALLPENEIRSIVKHHNIVSLSPPVQKFYNSPCASIEVVDASHFEEIEAVLKVLVSRAKWGT